MDHSQPQAISAPEWFAFCPRCATPMQTNMVMDRPRRVCPACQYVYFTDPKVGVGAAVIEDNRLLLVKRAYDPARGKWSLPAGYLDQGEDPAETTVRETFEETGCEVVIDGLVDIFFNPPAGGFTSIFILYRARRVGGNLAAGDDADEVGFFALDELPEIAFPSTRAAVELLLRDSHSALTRR